MASYSVMATPAALPGFWIFMYRVSPFTYITSAMLSTGLANNAVNCASIELLYFQPPAGQTCGEYMERYLSMAGGKVYNPNATTFCEYCAITSTNQFLALVNSFYSQRWRNYGFTWVYIVFNIFATIFLYWLTRVPKTRS